jgi:hypothetical protein
VNVCGPGAVPVRLQARRRGGEPIELDVVYRARPRSRHGVKGIEAESGQGSGGVGAPASGGVGAPRPR